MTLLSSLLKVGISSVLFCHYQIHRRLCYNNSRYVSVRICQWTPPFVTVVLKCGQVKFGSPVYVHRGPLLVGPTRVIAAPS